MEGYPTQPNLLPCQMTGVSLIGKVDELMTARSVPQRYPHQRYQKIELSAEEITAIGMIFEGHVLDAPETVSITLSGAYPAGSPEPRLSCQEVVFISTTYEDVRTEYCVWVNPGREPAVTFDKDSVRIQPSPKPYRIGPMACEAEIYEALSSREALTDAEQAALPEMLDALCASQ